MPNRAQKISEPFFKTRLVGIADELLHQANAKLDRKRKSAMGQFKVGGGQPLTRDIIEEKTKRTAVQIVPCQGLTPFPSTL